MKDEIKSPAYDPADYDNEILAIAEAYEISPDTISPIARTWDEFEDEEGNNYLVLTEAQADRKIKEYIRNTLDELVYPQIPESLQAYFDEESYVADVTPDIEETTALGYDVMEEIEINGRWYHVYMR